MSEEVKEANNVVDDHRNMLMVSKKLSDFQESNLKNWSFLFFDDLRSQKVDWNFIMDNENGDFYAGVVNFDLSLPETEKDYTQQIDQLVACTKFLFWSDTQVNILKNGKKWITRT